MTNSAPPEKNSEKPAGIDLSRRLMLKAAVGMAAGAALPGCGDGSSSSPAATNGPNVLFIVVDQLRYPKVFPAGITSPEQFLKTFMPNTYSLWQRGVKFSNHITASCACSPARGVLVTGLYAHQTFLATTLLNDPTIPFALSPPLDPRFPTYGKYFQSAGYATPYIGKWHCSVPHDPNGQGELSGFGFQAFIDPDPIANNLQGSYGASAAQEADLYPPDGVPFFSDAYIASVAGAWLSQQTPSSQRWCLTVGFQNPHDQEFYPAGTEFQTFANLYSASGVLSPSGASSNPLGAAQIDQYATSSACGNAVSWSTATSPYFWGIGGVATPKSYGYPPIPPNWESLVTLEAVKPGWQTVARQAFQSQFGGVTDDPTVTTFNVPVLQYPGGSPVPARTYAGYVNENWVNPVLGMAYGPYTYWQRSLDSYTQFMQIVDRNIGTVLAAVPADVLNNTVIVFTSDHGEYGGAHGLVTGKIGNAYDEAIRVPLIVVDHTKTFTGDIETVRTQLTSSVDITPMLVSLAYGGNAALWQQGDAAAMYGSRYNMFPLLKSAAVPGRRYALFSTDEVINPQADFVTPADSLGLKTPWHIISMVTPEAKLALYANWTPGTIRMIQGTMQGEYYDYGTAGGVLETSNTFTNPPTGNALAMQNQLLNELLDSELQAPLPNALYGVQQDAKSIFIAYMQDSAGFPFLSGRL